MTVSRYYGITIGSIMGGRKHLFGIESRLHSSCERALKHPGKRDTILEESSTNFMNGVSADEKSHIGQRH